MIETIFAAFSTGLASVLEYIVNSTVIALILTTAGFALLGYFAYTYGLESGKFWIHFIGWIMYGFAAMSGAGLLVTLLQELSKYLERREKEQLAKLALAQSGVSQADLSQAGLPLVDPNQLDVSQDELLRMPETNFWY